MLPTLAHMRKLGTPFTGFLYAGLMMTADGPKILEFNVRLGDPETQAILHNFPGDFAELLSAMTSDSATAPDSQPSDGCSVCITLAAANYPDTPRTGDIITGIAEAEVHRRHSLPRRNKTQHEPATRHQRRSRPRRHRRRGYSPIRYRRRLCVQPEHPFRRQALPQRHWPKRPQTLALTANLKLTRPADHPDALGRSHIAPAVARWRSPDSR